MPSSKQKTISALVWDFTGLILKQGIGLIISIFLARLLSPEEFGVLGIAIVFITVSQVFVEIGFTAALIQNKNNSNLIYSSVFFLNLGAGLLLTILFFFLAPFIGDFYDNETVSNLIQWLSLLFIFNAVSQVHIVRIKRDLNFKALTFRDFTGQLSGGILGVAAAFAGFGVYALAIQYLTAAFVSTIVLWQKSKWRPGLHFSFKEIKHITKYSSYVFFDQFLAAIFNRLDILLIGKIFSSATLGYYTQAVNLKNQVSNYSSSSLSKVFFPVLSNLQDRKDEYQNMYFKVISVVTFVSYGITGILYILGYDIIVLLFGEKWEPSVAIFQILMISVCNYPLNAMMKNALMGLGKSRENFYIGILRKIGVIIPLIFAWFFDITTYVIVFVVISYVFTFLNIFLLRKIIFFPVKNHISLLLKGMIPVISIIFLYHVLNFNYTCQRLIMAIAFFILYIIYSYLTKSQGLSLLSRTIIDFIKNGKKGI